MGPSVYETQETVRTEKHAHRLQFSSSSRQRFFSLWSECGLFVCSFFTFHLPDFVLIFQAIDGLWFREDFSFRCQPVDFAVTYNSMREARGCYVYFLAKMTELLDTVFFVLRKKGNQITFLHMYHHTVMPMVSWGCTKYYPGGHGTFIGEFTLSALFFLWLILYFHLQVSSTPSCTSSCTCTICLLPSDPNSKSTSGGRSTLQSYKWWVRAKTNDWKLFS